MFIEISSDCERIDGEAQGEVHDAPQCVLAGIEAGRAVSLVSRRVRKVQIGEVQDLQHRMSAQSRPLSIDSVSAERPA